MKLSKLLAKKSISNVRGQGMSEYLIIVALIAVAAIAVVGLFGGAARDQVAGLATEISGGTSAQTVAKISNAQEAAAAARTDSDQNVHLGSYAGGSTIIHNADGTGRAAGATGEGL